MAAPLVIDPHTGKAVPSGDVQIGGLRIKVGLDCGKLKSEINCVTGRMVCVCVYGEAGWTLVCGYRCVCVCVGKWGMWVLVVGGLGVGVDVDVDGGGGGVVVVSVGLGVLTRKCSLQRANAGNNCITTQRNNYFVKTKCVCTV